MAKDYEKLRKIYDRTDGYCHLCHKKLSFTNHGLAGAKGSWHIEHSIPRSNGGSNHLNNLFAACISCNLEKSNQPNRVIRNQYGISRAPYSKKKKLRMQEENTTTGIISGGIIGSLFGPGGMIVGGLLGGIIGKNSSDKT